MAPGTSNISPHHRGLPNPITGTSELEQEINVDGPFKRTNPVHNDRQGIPTEDLCPTLRVMDVEAE